MADFLGGLMVILGAIFLWIAIPLAFITLAYWIVCLCFGLEFSFLVAIGIYVICMVIKWLLSSIKSD